MEYFPNLNGKIFGDANKFLHFCFTLVIAVEIMTLFRYFLNSSKFISKFLSGPASSASPPSTSTSHKRHLSLVSMQQRQLQVRRRFPSKNILRIQHQNKSDPSSSDDGMPIKHNTTGIHMAYNKTVAGVVSESIEMKQHRKIAHEDSAKTTSTLSPRTFSSEHNTTETNLSVDTVRSFDKDESCYKRSRSYHGKSSKGLLKLMVSRCCNKTIKMVIGSFSLYSLYLFAMLYLRT